MPTNSNAALNAELGTEAGDATNPQNPTTIDSAAGGQPHFDLVESKRSSFPAIEIELGRFPGDLAAAVFSGVTKGLAQLVRIRPEAEEQDARNRAENARKTRETEVRAGEAQIRAIEAELRTTASPQQVDAMAAYLQSIGNNLRDLKTLDDDLTVIIAYARETDVHTVALWRKGELVGAQPLQFKNGAVELTPDRSMLVVTVDDRLVYIYDLRPSAANPLRVGPSAEFETDSRVSGVSAETAADGVRIFLDCKNGSRIEFERSTDGLKEVARFRPNNHTAANVFESDDFKSKDSDPSSEARTLKRDDQRPTVKIDRAAFLANAA